MARLKRPELRAEAARRNREQLARAGRQLMDSRRRRRMTQAQVAARIGVVQSTISRLERGRGGSLSADVWQRAFTAVDRLLVLEVSRDPLEETADAGHLAIQELVLGYARTNALPRTFELPTRPSARRGLPMSASATTATGCSRSSSAGTRSATSAQVRDRPHARWPTPRWSPWPSAGSDRTGWRRAGSFGRRVGTGSSSLDTRRSSPGASRDRPRRGSGRLPPAASRRPNRAWSGAMSRRRGSSPGDAREGGRGPRARDERRRPNARDVIGGRLPETPAQPEGAASPPPVARMAGHERCRVPGWSEPRPTPSVSPIEQMPRTQRHRRRGSRPTRAGRR